MYIASIYIVINQSHIPTYINVDSDNEEVEATGLETTNAQLQQTSKHIYSIYIEYLCFLQVVCIYIYVLCIYVAYIRTLVS